MTPFRGVLPRLLPALSLVLLAAASPLTPLPASAEPLLLPPLYPAPLEIQQGPPCEQRSLDVARLEDGRLIAVWVEDSPSAPRVLGRFLTADGVPLGDEIELVSPPAGPLGDVRVVEHLNRGFLIAWAYHGGLGLAAHLELVAFDESGLRINAADVQVAPGASITGFALDHEDFGLTSAVAWTDGSIAWARLFDGNLQPQSGAIAVGEPAEPGGLVGTVDVARLAAGETVVVWEEGSTLAGPPPYGLDAVRGRVIYQNGQTGPPAFTVNQLPARASAAPGLSPSIAGSFSEVVVAWVNQDAAEVPRGVYAQRLLRDGSPIGESFQVSTTELAAVGEATVTSALAGGFAVAWQGRETPIEDPVVFARVFDRAGEPKGQDFGLWHSEPGRIQSEPAVVAGLGLTLLWRDYLPPPAGSLGPVMACAADSRLRVRSARFACQPSRQRLCLVDGRFEIETLLRVPGGGIPSYDAVDGELVSPEAALFTFFGGRPENIELMVKLLDARAVNGRFWFFSGALTDRRYEIHVRDLQTSRFGVYDSQSGSGAGPLSFADLRTFADPVPAPAPSPAVPPPAAEASAAEGPCDAQTLCLHGQRFRVRATWSGPLGGGEARATALSGLGGYFWFGRESNPEIAVKVLDGRAINGYSWVFVGGLSGRPYTVRVEDDETGESWSYTHPGGSVASHADTRALAGSP